jgi:hypothetical protein
VARSLSPVRRRVDVERRSVEAHEAERTALPEGIRGNFEPQIAIGAKPEVRDVIAWQAASFAVAEKLLTIVTAQAGGLHCQPHDPVRVLDHPMDAAGGQAIGHAEVVPEPLANARAHEGSIRRYGRGAVEAQRDVIVDHTEAAGGGVHQGQPRGGKEQGLPQRGYGLGSRDPQHAAVSAVHRRATGIAHLDHAVPEQQGADRLLKERVELGSMLGIDPDGQSGQCSAGLGRGHRHRREQ